MASPVDKMEAYIKDLPLDRRNSLVENYAGAGLMFPGFLKYRTPPQIYVSCPREDRAPAAMGSLEAIQSYAPATLGRRAGAADKAGIEIYLAAEPDEFTRRDRDTKARLRLDAHISAKTILNIDPLAFGKFAAPCWSVIYFDKRTGVIEKSLIFIDSDAPSRMQSLCMTFELVRAVGVVSTPSVTLYHKTNAPLAKRDILWLAANAYMHGLAAIRPGDKYENVLSVLKTRYGLTESP